MVYLMTGIESLILQPRSIWKHWISCSGGTWAGHGTLDHAPQGLGVCYRTHQKVTLMEWRNNSIKGVFKLKLHNAYRFHYKNIIP